MNNKNISSKDNKLIICFTGMPGAGKSTASMLVEDLGYDVVNMGKAVREETTKRGLEMTDKNVGSVMLDLRQQHGMNAVAHLVLPSIKSSKKKIVFVDGVRNLEEIELFKEIGKVKVLLIHTSPEIRFKFLQNRGRKDAPIDLKPFNERDEREMSIGLVKIIALADEVISNNGITISQLKEETKKIINKWVDSFEN